MKGLGMSRSGRLLAVLLILAPSIVPLQAVAQTSPQAPASVQ
jgi:hypothetical protein